MASLSTKIKLYLEANSKTWETETNNIMLQNNMDGKGDFIATWSVDGLSKPTDSQLNSYESTGNTREALNIVLDKRKREYLSWNEQLDKLYHDIDNGKFGDTAKTSTWYTHIKSVKDANSKG